MSTGILHKQRTQRLYFLNEYEKLVKYKQPKNRDNVVISPDYKCQGRIALYRAGPRYVSWAAVSILYRYIAISSHPYCLGTYIFADKQKYSKIHVCKYFIIWYWNVHKEKHYKTETPIFSYLTPVLNLLAFNIWAEVH